ncbi:hypothetical protein AAEO56_14865 [Flavobacterium sp. DGU11]|uniref:Uncharacterized protein n=1 Tax=Flavobacterium arundinis TaxID=3139143 RepID=A0ABU9HZG0_9FLAO
MFISQRLIKISIENKNHYICEMRHKLLSYFVCLLTSTILLAHALVPHHHEQEHSIVGHHDHEADGGLKGVFTTHCHSSDCFTSLVKHTTEQSQYKHVESAILANDIAFIQNSSFSKPKNYISCNYTPSSFHLLHIDFRGPPAFSV